MSVGFLFVKILEVMFVAGWAGSTVLLIITGVEDIATLFDTEDEDSQ